MAKKKININEKQLGNKTNSLVFLDYETGGFEATQHAITEIAMIAIRGDNFETIDTLSTYIQPYGDYKYEEEALKATGITFKDIDSGITIEEATDKVLALLKRADLYNSKGFKPLLFAHNGEFDKTFWMQQFVYCKKVKEMSKLVYGNVDYYGNFQPYVQDTVVLGKMAFGHIPDFGNMKLANYIAGCGAELSDAHKAINDTIGLQEATNNLIKAMRIGFGNSEQEIAKQTRFREHFQL